MKARKSTFCANSHVFRTYILLYAFKPVNADTYNIGNYTVTENGNVVSVTDQETGLSAYLNRDTGLLTDIDGTVSYVKENNGVDYISAFSSSNLLATSGLRPGVWNYVTTVTYNLEYVQSVQSFILGFNCF